MRGSAHTAHTALVYLVLVGLPLLGLVGISLYGRGLDASSVAAGGAWTPGNQPSLICGAEEGTAGEPCATPSPAVPPVSTATLPMLFLQVGVVLLAARFLGTIFRRLGQPQVVGEMVAGIMLGPTLLGWLAPGISAVLFPAHGLELLNLLSQLGLTLFMFLVGLELNPQLLRGRGQAAVVISHASIVAPFFLGALLAIYLYPRLAPAGVGYTPFALFMGTAMSVTAFPVLARLMGETKLLRTRVGALTIACAAVDDVTAWCLLAAVVVFVRSSDSAVPLWITIGGTLAFAAFMLLVMRRALRGIEALYCRYNAVTQNILALVLLLVLGSAAVTELLGIHALFGAFLVGAIMPKERGLVKALLAKIEDVTVVLFVPLFFAYTGLRTSLGLLDGANMWLYCGAIILTAIAGKFGGSSLAAFTTGLPWRDAATLGILMNTRGLMELVVLNIGLDIGVISPALFSMMVLMALVTTFMTSPLLARLYPVRLYSQDLANAEPIPAENPAG